MSDTNTQPELLPCPMCGSSNVLIDSRPDDVGSTRWTAYCDNCLISTAGIWDREGAVKCWNKRHDAGLAARSPRDEEVEKAVEAVERLARAYEAHPPTSEASVEVGQSLRTLLDHVSHSKSPHPVERGEG